MYLNDYSVRVPEGHETGGYVELDHAQQYTLVLRNARNTRCDARMEVDGKHVGTWRLEAHQNATLERPAHDTGRFTFYKVGTPESVKAGLQEGDPNLGLIKVTFSPELETRPLVVEPKPRIPWNNKPWGLYESAADSGAPASYRTTVSYTIAYNNVSIHDLSGNNSYDAGGTGLSGKSNQVFGEAYAITYDYSQQTVIHLRLVGKSDEPRPLTSFSTPVPPAIR